MDTNQLMQKLHSNLLKINELLTKLEAEGQDEFWINGAVQLARDMQEDLLIYRFLARQGKEPVGQAEKGSLESKVQEANGGIAWPSPAIQINPNASPKKPGEENKTESNAEVKQEYSRRVDVSLDRNPIQETALPAESSQVELPKVMRSEENPAATDRGFEEAGGPQDQNKKETFSGIGLSFNDMASQKGGGNLADKLKQAKSKELKKSMPLHEKFRFINELFDGDNAPFNRFLEEIDACKDWPHASAMLQTEQTKRSWDTEGEVTQDFFALIFQKFAK